MSRKLGRSVRVSRKLTVCNGHATDVDFLEKVLAFWKDACFLEKCLLYENVKLVVLRSAQRTFSSPGPWPLNLR